MLVWTSIILLLSPSVRGTTNESISSSLSTVLTTIYLSTESPSSTPTPSVSPDQLSCVSDDGVLQICVSDHAECPPEPFFCSVTTAGTRSFPFTKNPVRPWTWINITLYGDAFVPFNFALLESHPNLNLSVRSNNTTIFAICINENPLFNESAFRSLVFDNVNVSIDLIPTYKRYPIWNSLQFLNQTDVDWSSWQSVNLSRVRNIIWGTNRLRSLFYPSGSGPLGNLSQSDEYVFGENSVSLVNNGAISENVSESFEVILERPVTLKFTPSQNSSKIPINFYVAEGVSGINITIKGTPPPDVPIALAISQRQQVNVAIEQDFLPLSITGSGAIHVTTPSQNDLRAQPISVNSGAVNLSSNAPRLSLDSLNFWGWSGSFRFLPEASGFSRLLKSERSAFALELNHLTVAANSNGTLETPCFITDIEIGENSTLKIDADLQFDAATLRVNYSTGHPIPPFFIVAPNVSLLNNPVSIRLVGTVEDGPRENFDIICGEEGFNCLQLQDVNFSDDGGFYSLVCNETTHCLVASVKPATQQASRDIRVNDGGLKLTRAFTITITVSIVAVLVFAILVVLLLQRLKQSKRMSFQPTESAAKGDNSLTSGQDLCPPSEITDRKFWDIETD